MNTLEQEYPMGIGMRRIRVAPRGARIDSTSAGERMGALPWLLVALAALAAVWGWTLMRGGLPPSLFGWKATGGRRCVRRRRHRCCRRHYPHGASAGSPC